MKRRWFGNDRQIGPYGPHYSAHCGGATVIPTDPGDLQCVDALHTGYLAVVELGGRDHGTFEGYSRRIHLVNQQRQFGVYPHQH